MIKPALLGIPYDRKSSFMRGPSMAPSEIRKCLNSYSTNLFAENGISIESNFTDLGDIVVEDYFDLTDQIKNLLLSHPRILSLGGDHSISYPVFKAYAGLYPKLEILHIDAHADLYDELDGDKYSHACPFARIMEENLASRLVQVGIRTLNTHQREQSEKFGTEIIEMKDFEPGRMPVFSKPLYLSIDLDGLDPAYAPGVSHHEPGGLTSRQVIDIIHGIGAPVIGADIVELNPLRDVNGITAALAAKLAKEIISCMLD
ncbi:MAG: agmatinase [Marinilabiliaceae bacterium]|jgi:agmatinase|nr:agmatinase [Marinilabiliaceae bacterium]